METRQLTVNDFFFTFFLVPLPAYSKCPLLDIEKNLDFAKPPFPPFSCGKLASTSGQGKTKPMCTIYVSKWLFPVVLLAVKTGQTIAKKYLFIGMSLFWKTIVLLIFIDKYSKHLIISLLDFNHTGYILNVKNVLIWKSSQKQCSFLCTSEQQCWLCLPCFLPWPEAGAYWQTAPKIEGVESRFFSTSMFPLHVLWLSTI